MKKNLFMNRPVRHSFSEGGSLGEGLCLVAGGSGGHIFPALVLAKKWIEKNPDGKIIFFCGEKKLDRKIIETNNFIYKVISIKLLNFPGKKIFLYPKFSAQLFFSFFKIFYFLLKYPTHKVVTTGGYLAVPVCTIAKLFFRNFVELYELNVAPGKAIKALSFFADKIFITFQESKSFFNKRSNKCCLTNYPLRFVEEDKKFDKNVVFQKINCNLPENGKFANDRKTIFLLGGSQGSVFLNNLFKNWLEKNQNLQDKIQIIHQTGQKDKTNWEIFYGGFKVPKIIFSYDENIKDYYLVSDLVISRAGAGTLFELEFFAKKSLIIPLKTSYTMHQCDNALAMSRKNPDLFFVQDQDLVANNFSSFENKLLNSLNL